MPTHNIFTNNMEMYEDPEFYDLQYQSYMKDFPLLFEWAKRQGGNVIDLACGTGRMTIPIAEKGFHLIGVDLNVGMLERAKEKSVNLPIEWVLQDCSNLSLPTTSPFIYMTGNSFQHFLTNESQNQLFQSIYKHLDQNGVFIFGARFPILSDLSDKYESIKTYVDQRNRKVKNHKIEEFDTLAQILHCRSTREILNEQEEVVSIEKDRISLRYVFPKEMERLIEQNGFTILHAYGTWDKKPLSEKSKEMIYVCKKGSAH